MRVVSVSVTEAGRSLAAALPYETFHGGAADHVRRLWGEVDGFVLVLATGAALRMVAPVLSSKADDPAVVCVDEAGRWAVSLCGGHKAGANALATEVAALLRATAVITTATDATAAPALDMLPGFVATGDLAGVTTSMLGGTWPRLERELPQWPLPAALRPGSGPATVVVTDRVRPVELGTVLLHPPSLVVGMGCSSDASADAARQLLDATLAEEGLARESIALVATIDRRADHRAMSALGLPVRGYDVHALASTSVPNPSAAVASAVGTPSVAEAAALLAAGPGAQLLVEKRRSRSATVAVARRLCPPGTLSVVGLGPGGAEHRTPAVSTAVRGAEVVIGYGPYVDQAADLLTASQVVERSPIGAELERAQLALDLARQGRNVALVCSGDAGVFAMAAVVGELAGAGAEVDVRVLPGVTAALAAASLLGAPLGHDHALISLSDLLTPWEVIEARVHAAGAGDFVVAFYNPRSRGRDWQLGAALDILRGYRPLRTPVGIVCDALREGQQVVVTTLEDVDVSHVSMTTCVVVGSSTTQMIHGRMVTPRGYKK
ncbi:MAG: precorrin-3B C(17)-methyltransferase [Acidimicrobiales bacterium]